MLRTAVKGLVVLAIGGFVQGTQQAQAGCPHCGGGSYGYVGGWGCSSGYCAMAPAPTPLTRPALPAKTPVAATYNRKDALSRDSALLLVKVPAEAKVFINDQLTVSTGADREYVSRDLLSGPQYKFVVRAEFVHNGRTASENKTVQLTAGQTANLDFTQGEANAQTAGSIAAQSPETHTTLTVRVPADAKLYLYGHEMKANGPVREFSTTKLPAGSRWAKYPIRAVMEKDGQQQVREQTVSIKAGESHEVSINFENPASEQIAKKSTR